MPTQCRLKLALLLLAGLSSLSLPAAASQANPLIRKTTTSGSSFFDYSKPPPQRPAIQTERFIPETVKVGTGQKAQ